MSDKPTGDDAADAFAEFEQWVSLGDKKRAEGEAEATRRVEAFESGDPSWVEAEEPGGGIHPGGIQGGGIQGDTPSRNTRNRERIDLREVREQRILFLIERDPGATVADISAAMKQSKPTIKRALYGRPGRFSGLVEDGKVRAEAGDPGEPTRYYPS